MKSAALNACLGETITSISLASNEIVIGLGYRRALVISDSGQNCCETRYIEIDLDEARGFIGAKLVGVDVGEVVDVDCGEYGEVHEVQFLNIRTSDGVISARTHVEHNGYYGGFLLTVALREWLES